MTLSLCARCARHVRDDATACPFCGATMTTTMSSPALAPSPRRVLAMVAAASALTVAGCDAVSGDDERAKIEDRGAPAPAYGVAMDPAPVAPEAPTTPPPQAGPETKPEPER